MADNITWEALWAVMGAIAAIVASAFAVWWRIESRVEKAKKEALEKVLDVNEKVEAVRAKTEMTASQFAEYRTYVAETYATKSGLTEQMTVLAKAINDVGERLDKRLDGMTERLDRVIEAHIKPP